MPVWFIIPASPRCSSEVNIVLPFCCFFRMPQRVPSSKTVLAMPRVCTEKLQFCYEPCNELKADKGYIVLVYTTQVNSAFRALWLVNSEVISKYYSPPSNRREKYLNFWPLVTHKITFWSANYSACVVYTKTIIHLRVGESDGYLPRRFAAR